MLVKSDLISSLSESLGSKITDLKAVSGACTNIVHRALGEGGREYIVKSGSSTSDAYEIESLSLQELAQCPVIRVPKVIFQNNKFLVLEYIEPGPKNIDAFATAIDSLHQVSSHIPGFRLPTYLGHFLQSNDSQSLSWPDFYWHHRIYPLYLKCVEKGVSSVHLDELIVKAENNISEVLSELTSFSLLHCDLWSGNYFYDRDGKLVLIDPALYYGDPLCDLAMLDLFGGEESTLFEKKLRRHNHRVQLYKSYYLLYHLYDCGSTYLNDTCRALSLFG